MTLFPVIFPATNSIYQIRSEKSLKLPKKEDLSRYKEQIKELLRLEIVTRYYYQKGKVESSLKNDPELALAISTLKDKEKYQSILSGKYVQPKPEIPVTSEEDEDTEN